MNLIKLKELLDRVEHIANYNEIDNDIYLSPCLPLDNIEANSLLFLTERIDGEDVLFDQSSVDKKPYAIVADMAAKIVNESSPVIRVKNARKAYAYAISLSCDIDYSKFKVIGVTGTNGKTTTATLIYRILRYAGYNVGFIGTGKILINDTELNHADYSMTTPDPTLLYPTLKKMQDECNYIVMEISSHSIALGKIEAIPFEYCIFTNLSEEHLDFHNNMDTYFKCKLSLFEKCKKGLFNMDDPYSRKAYHIANCHKSSIGVIQEADAYATDIKEDLKDGISFYYRTSGLISPVCLYMVGSFNVYNAMLALKCTIDLGIKPCIAKNAISLSGTVEGRMEKYEQCEDINIFIDYAHTAGAFENCLKCLFLSNKTKQKLIVVFGCGGNRDRSKRGEMGRLASKYADEIIITEDNNRDEVFEDIVSDIIKGVYAPSYTVIKDRSSAITKAISMANNGDTVAIIGKGHEKYMISNGKYEYFDEREIVKNALKIRSHNNES